MKKTLIALAAVAATGVAFAQSSFASGERFVLEKIEIDSRQRSRGYGSTVIERLRQKAVMRGVASL